MFFRQFGDNKQKSLQYNGEHLYEDQLAGNHVVLHQWAFSIKYCKHQFLEQKIEVLRLILNVFQLKPFFSPLKGFFDKIVQVSIFRAKN